MSELIRNIKTIEYIDTKEILFNYESPSATEIAEIYIENEKRDRIERYQNSTDVLDIDLFNKIRGKKVLTYNPNKNIGDNGSKSNKQYINCFDWDMDGFNELPENDYIDKKSIINFLNPKKDITNDEAEQLLISNTNTLVYAMTLLTNNYLWNVEELIDNARKRQFYVEAHALKEPDFLFTEEEEKLFLVGRTMLIAYNSVLEGRRSEEEEKTKEEKYIYDLIRETDDVICRFNQGLIGNVVKKYRGYGNFNDLFQEGNDGLLRALRTFEIDRNYKFSTYSTYWVRQRISRSIANNASTIRTPVHMRDSVNRFVRTKRTLEAKLGTEVSIEEAFDYCNDNGIKIPPDIDIIVMVLNQRNIVDLDKETREGDEDSSSLMDLIPDSSLSVEDVVLSYYNEKLLDEIFILAGLKWREKLIIKLRWGIIPNDKDPKKGKYTLTEVGKKLGITRERVRQVEFIAMRKLTVVAKRMPVSL